MTTITQKTSVLCQLHCIITSPFFFESRDCFVFGNDTPPRKRRCTTDSGTPLLSLDLFLVKEALAREHFTVYVRLNFELYQIEQEIFLLLKSNSLSKLTTQSY